MKRAREYDEDKENTLVDEPFQKRTKANLTPVKRQPFRRTYQKKNTLSDAVLKHVKRLGARVPVKVTAEAYRNNFYTRPIPMQYFTDIKWPLGARFKSNMFGLSNIQFGTIDLDVWDSVQFLRFNQDALIVGVGNALLVTKMRPHEELDHSNFDVWIVGPQRYEGPFNLSEILTSVELDEQPRMF
jgi:hypothetical protein